MWQHLKKKLLQLQLLRTSEHYCAVVLSSVCLFYRDVTKMAGPSSSAMEGSRTLIVGSPTSSMGMASAAAASEGQSKTIDSMRCYQSLLLYSL